MESPALDQVNLSREWYMGEMENDLLHYTQAVLSPRGGGGCVGLDTARQFGPLPRQGLCAQLLPLCYHPAFAPCCYTVESLAQWCHAVFANRSWLYGIQRDPLVAVLWFPYHGICTGLIP
ncbi:BCL2/adenovirus E1B 19 kDa protein-interacting protein 3 [Platysternon megacephalum]|uniref:BCL2/adenovirus E1B 19 kDa protein-interacting protein 3 n=1 Tax=Platysternon megacephalum TaxID=55544 RepID=A0A4D9DY36_9SAUR|nr:BCL2/adenovirus E1B 19 kDa protein-interacting protein 3 [Platysternon megacephalum]